MFVDSIGYWRGPGEEGGSGFLEPLPSGKNKIIFPPNRPSQHYNFSRLQRISAPQPNIYIGINFFLTRILVNCSYYIYIAFLATENA